jgi:hypothetical protein
VHFLPAALTNGPEYKENIASPQTPDQNLVKMNSLLCAGDIIKLTKNQYIMSEKMQTSSYNKNRF